MRKIKVEITRKHIDTAGYGGNNCPVYVAMKEQHPEIDTRLVKTSYIRYNKGQIANLPKNVRAWITNHDYWKKVQEFTWGQEIQMYIHPITFELEVENGD